MRLVTDLILAPTVEGARCARESQYIGEARYLRASYSTQPAGWSGSENAL